VSPRGVEPAASLFRASEAEDCKRPIRITPQPLLERFHGFGCTTRLEQHLSEQLRCGLDRLRQTQRRR
jgi:hypothetical protein